MNLETFKDQTILLLGKPRAFSDEEFLAQLERHGIAMTKEIDEDLRYILEGRMMTPYEQNLSDELYEKGEYTFLKIDDFEKAMAKEIDDDALLMSLKLSNDKERLKSFLQNSCVSNALFFKLLKMYEWQGEDFFENDDNRDVSAALIGRFYENIERNHNVQYATTGIIHLVSQTQNRELLEAISELEPLQFHPKISILLAQHPQSSQKVLKKLLKSKNEDVLEAMSLNAALDDVMRDALLEHEKYAKNIAKNILLDDALFKRLLSYAQELACNPSLSEAMQKELFLMQDNAVLLALAANTSLSEAIVNMFLNLDDEKITEELYANANLNEALLREAFESEQHHKALSRNPATPQDILQELFALGESEVLENLARNENTPIDILYQLQLDRRFERAVKTNAAFGKHVQSENIGWLV
jgi:hypothetical protein